MTPAACSTLRSMNTAWAGVCAKELAIVSVEYRQLLASFFFSVEPFSFI